NAFRIRTDHLEARKLFVDRLAPLVRGEEVVVVSPDAGGVKRAEDFRQSLSRALGHDVSKAFMEKYRSEGVVSGEAVIGEGAEKLASIIDYLCSRGTPFGPAAERCPARGAKGIYAAAPHGVFSNKPTQVLSPPALEKIVITDTIPPFRL